MMHIIKISLLVICSPSIITFCVIFISLGAFGMELPKQPKVFIQHESYQHNSKKRSQTQMLGEQPTYKEIQKIPCGFPGCAIFLEKNNIKLHRYTHCIPTDRPFECSECHHPLIHRGQFNMHIKNNHSSAPHVPHCLRHEISPDGKKRLILMEKRAACPPSELTQQELDLLWEDAISKSLIVKKFKHDSAGNTIKKTTKVFHCGYPTCNASYSKPLNVESHRYTHCAPNDRPFECSKCHAPFIYKLQFNAHVKRHHPHDATPQFIPHEISCQGIKLLALMLARANELRKTNKVVETDNTPQTDIFAFPTDSLYKEFASLLDSPNPLEDSLFHTDIDMAFSTNQTLCDF